MLLRGVLVAVAGVAAATALAAELSIPAGTTPAPRPPTAVERGYLSFYADALHGHPTASGASYDRTALTAAHPTLPFGTAVRVTNVANGRSVLVRINDRGPGDSRRILDLSRAAAAELRMIGRGVVRGRVEVVPDADTDMGGGALARR